MILRRTLAVAVAACAASGAVALIARATAAEPPPGPVPEGVTRADALAYTPARTRPGPSYTAAKARPAASLRGLSVPLPAGGTFSGIRWEQGGDTVDEAEIDSVLQYNGMCQWLRAWRDGREAALAVRILQTVPDWPAMRAGDSRRLLRQMAADVAGGGGATAQQVLRDCDASHDREVRYATGLGLAASR